MSEDEGYDGPAELVVGGQVLAVDVRLRGMFQPLDGRYHWYGRVAHDADLDALDPSGATVRLRLPARVTTPAEGGAGGGDAVAEGAAESEARLSDPDPWGRFRVAGVGRPPW